MGNETNRILSLGNITKLIFNNFNVSLGQLLDVLRFTVQLQILKCPISSPLENPSEKSLEYESFTLVSNTNNIKIVHLSHCSGLDDIPVIVNLFPRVEQLTIGTQRKKVNLAVKFFFSKNNINTSKLFFLCITMVPKVCLHEVKKLIKSEKLIVDKYLIKHVNQNLYLCW